MLSLEQLTIDINQKMLLNKVSVTFLNSSITYLQGSNGSGKTSLLRVLARIMKPGTGKIIYDNNSTINYIGHDLGLKQELAVIDHLKFWSSIYDSHITLKAAVHYFNLEDLLDKKIYQLSAGNQKKTALAKLLCCQADLWLLDEASTNLDEMNQKLLNNLIISKANNGGIIILTSHNDHYIKDANFLNLADFK